MGLSAFQVLSTPINNAAILSVSCTFGLNSQLSLKKDFCLKSFKKKVLSKKILFLIFIFQSHMFTLILELCHFDLICWLKYSSSSAPTALLSWWSLRKGSSLALLAEDGHFPSTPVARPTLPILQGQVGLAFYLLFSSEWLVFHRYRALLLSGFTLDYQNPYLVPVNPKKQTWWENQELEQIIFILNVPSKMKNTFLRSLKMS